MQKTHDRVRVRRTFTDHADTHGLYFLSESSSDLAV